tara:strand:+ start:5535 stop:5714 length:180 start_codon:yes stop_codon:yes gene_type:complete
MPKPKEITGYDIIIHWSDGTKEDLDTYGPYPYNKSLDYYLDAIQEEVNEQTDETEESDA